LSAKTFYAKWLAEVVPIFSVGLLRNRLGGNKSGGRNTGNKRNNDKDIDNHEDEDERKRARR
jgi:hypothetical protein